MVTDYEPERTHCENLTDAATKRHDLFLAAGRTILRRCNLGCYRPLEAKERQCDDLHSSISPMVC